MAKTTGPLISISAHGDIGNAMQFQRTKGRNIVRVKPPMPYVTSPGLVTARAHHASAIYAYRYTFTAPEWRLAWNRLATYRHDRMSQYDEAIKAFLTAYAQSAAPKFVSDAWQYQYSGIMFIMRDLTTGAYEDEPDQMTVFIGRKPDRLQCYGAPSSFGGGAYVINHDIDNFPLYVQVMVESQARSGIIEIAEPVNPYPILDQYTYPAHAFLGHLTPAPAFNGSPSWITDDHAAIIWNAFTPQDVQFFYNRTPGTPGTWWWNPVNPDNVIGGWCYKGNPPITFTINVHP